MGPNDKPNEQRAASSADATKKEPHATSSGKKRKHAKGAARSRDINKKESTLAGLLEHHTRLLGQLVTNMVDIQRAVATASVSTSDGGQEKQPRKEKDHAKHMAGIKSENCTSTGVLQQSGTV